MRINGCQDWTAEFDMDHNILTISNEEGNEVMYQVADGAENAVMEGINDYVEQDLATLQEALDQMVDTYLLYRL